MSYPILVERFEKDQSVTIICTTCERQELITPDDINQDGTWACETCPGTMVFMYDLGERCPSCGELGYFSDLPTKGCCSRVCMLQKEYAESLGST